MYPYSQQERGQFNNSTMPHFCCHTCIVTNEFGNLWKCQSSGQLHVCDANCDQRLYNDRYSTICRVSKKLFPPFEMDEPMGGSTRKRPAEAEGSRNSWEHRKQRNTIVYG